MRTELVARLVQADQAITEVTDVVKLVVAIVVGVVLALALAEVTSGVVRAVGRRSWLAVTLAARARRPLRAVMLVVAVWIGLRVGTTPPPGATRAGWILAIEHGLRIALIVAVAWLIGALAFVVEDAALKRFRSEVADDRHARRIRTQITVLRRVTVTVLVLCTVAAVLLTFPSARAAGASVLASAGVVSLVAGLAAQSVLGNFFAGVQLAFSDAIRMGDVVVVDGEWGRIEEITMTYVVVHIWDDRRLILPSTRFTSSSFENWTRRSSDLLGTVEIDLDWNVPIEAMRTELRRLLDATDLWDGRVGVLQVTDASKGAVRTRALASAANSGALWDLRCYLREGLVGWLQREMPSALPRTRWEAGAPPVPTTATAQKEHTVAPVIEVPGAAAGGASAVGSGVPSSVSSAVPPPVAATAAATVGASTGAHAAVPSTSPSPDLDAAPGPSVVEASSSVAATDVSAPAPVVVPAPEPTAAPTPAATPVPGADPAAESPSDHRDDVPTPGPATLLLTTSAPSTPAPSTTPPSTPTAVLPMSGDASTPGDGTLALGAAEPAAPGSDGTPAVVSRRSARRSAEGTRQSGEQETIRLDLSASDSRLFTGSIDAIERSKAFSGPGEDVYAERDEAARKTERAEHAEQQAAERQAAEERRRAAEQPDA